MKLHERKLRLALKSNAIFSLTTGTALLVAPKLIAAKMGIGEPIVLTVIGIGLLLFVLFLLYVAFAKTMKTTLVLSIVAMDGAWVVASLLLLISRPLPLMSFGYSLIGLIALIVAVLGLWQYREFKQLTHDS